MLTIMFIILLCHSPQKTRPVNQITKVYGTTIYLPWNSSDRDYPTLCTSSRFNSISSSVKEDLCLQDIGREGQKIYW